MRAALVTITISLTFAASAALAQTPANWPAKPVRMMLGPGPGSVADGLTRVMAQALSEHWSQQVIVENRSGAGNTIAPSIVAKSAPDGYTLHRCGVGGSIAPALFKKLSYNHLKDFAILAHIGHTPNILRGASELTGHRAAGLHQARPRQPGQARLWHDRDRFIHFPSNF